MMNGQKTTNKKLQDLITQLKSELAKENEDISDEIKHMYEGSICICCMATEDLIDLFPPHGSISTEPDYAKIIRSCFTIELSQTDGHSSICADCVIKLKDAVALKRQIITSISILTSASVRQLVREPEDIAVLGFNTDISIKENDNSKLNTIRLTNENSDDDSNPLCLLDSDDDQKDSKNKKRIGRRRKYPKFTLPYDIGPNELKCRECDKEFPSHIMLKGHYNEHFPNFICNVCDKGFMTYMGLNKHQLTHVTGPFRCNICDKEFNHLNSLHSHKRLKHTTYPLHRCRVCNKRFWTVKQKLSHLTTDHGWKEARYKCQYCDKSFITSATKAKHVWLQHQESHPYSCPLCDFKSRRASVRIHLANKHGMGEKRHKCLDCDKKFSKKNTLVEHMRAHLEDRRFRCKLCNKSFVQKSTLKKHVQTHIRKFEFKGDPGSLMITNEDSKSGMLEERLDENLLADDSFSEQDAEDVEFLLYDQDIDNIDDIDSNFEVEALEECNLNSEGLEIDEPVDIGYKIK